MNQVKKYLILLLLCAIVAGMLSCGAGEKEEYSPPPVRSEPEYYYPGNRPVPYQFGKTYNYVYIREGEDIGNSSFKIDELENDGYSIYSSIDFDNDYSEDMIRGDSTLIVDENWQLVKYSREIEARYGLDSSLDGLYAIDIEHVDNEMVAEIIEPGYKEPVIQRIRTVTTEVEDLDVLRIDKVFLFDNNCIGLMAYICSQPELRSGRRALIDILSITYRDKLTLSMTPIIKKELEYHGKTAHVYKVDMKADEMTFGIYYITPEGIILRAEEEGGFLIVELQNPDW